MKTSARGIQLIKKYEGLKLIAYRCPAGVWTIGYGHTRTATAGLRITEQQAHELLVSDLAIAETVVSGKLKNINQNAFDALVSFVFNLGERSFLQSTLLKKIAEGETEADIRAEFAKWVNAAGRMLPGLVARRKEEAELFFKK